VFVFVLSVLIDGLEGCWFVGVIAAGLSLYFGLELVDKLLIDIYRIIANILMHCSFSLIIVVCCV